MKKARIMLTAIAVFAVVGGALAFNAKKFGGKTYFTTDAINQPAVNVYTSGIFTTTTTAPYYYYSTVQNATAVVGARFLTIP